MQVIDGIFYIAILIMSFVVHEYAHGYMAYYYGDSTAYLKGRLTLNPLKQIDPVGSVVLPAILLLSGSNFLIGWAKAIPYNPDNIKGGKKAHIFVAAAGIIANLMIAIIFGLLVRILSNYGLNFLNQDTLLSLYEIGTKIVLLNIVLVFFNLFPISPFDGFKILCILLPAKYYKVQDFLEKFQIPIFFIFLFFIWGLFSPIIFWLARILIGG